MCIVACVQCDSEFRMGDACYECAIYRSNAYCEYATLLVLNVQIITERHGHNVHCSMLRICVSTFTIDSQKFDNVSTCITSLFGFHPLSSTYRMSNISGDACWECATHWPNAHCECATLHIANMQNSAHQDHWYGSHTEYKLQCTLWMSILALFCIFTTCNVAHSQCAFAQFVAHSQHASPDILNIMYVLKNRWNTYYEVIMILKLSNLCVSAVNV